MYMYFNASGDLKGGGGGWGWGLFLIEEGVVKGLFLETFYNLNLVDVTTRDPPLNLILSA